MKRPVAASTTTYLRHAAVSDTSEFVAASIASSDLHHPYVHPPLNETEFRAWLLRGQRADIEQYLICDRMDDEIVGFVNLNNIIRGNLQQAFIGYAGMAGHERQGHTTAGVELALRAAFTVTRLHRVEANIQPGNIASRRLAIRAGFRLEGYSPAYLRVDGVWEDHERWAILSDDWRERTGTRASSERTATAAEGSESSLPAGFREHGSSDGAHSSTSEPR